MDAFIFLALVVIYVTISYVPVSETPKRLGKVTGPSSRPVLARSRTETPGRRFVTAIRVKGVESSDLGKPRRVLTSVQPAGIRPRWVKNADHLQQ